jgi:SAM-dependent methyltransferase
VAEEPIPGLNTRVAHIARIYNYWLGGKDNFAVDREAGDRALAAEPSIGVAARANRQFLGRAAQFLVRDAGIRQFLDIGTGIPTADNTHEVAQRAAADTRVVYVDNDPMVLVHARALLTSTPEGVTSYIQADLRDTDQILRQAAQTLDFEKPVALTMLMVLHCIPDGDDPHGILRRLLAAVVPGSYLVLSHPAKDIRATTGRTATQALNSMMGPTQITIRSRAEIERFFEGLDLLDPGVVQLPYWRPGPGGPGNVPDSPAYCGVGRKPENSFRYSTAE